MNECFEDYPIEEGRGIVGRKLPNRPGRYEYQPACGGRGGRHVYRLEVGNSVADAKHDFRSILRVR